MACGSASKLQENIDYPCVVPTPGVRAKIWIGNLADVDTFSRKSVDPDSPDSVILSTLVLKTGKKLKTIEGFRLSNVPTVGYNNTAYATYLPHNFQLAIFDKSEKGRHAANVLVKQEDLFIIYREKALTGNFIVNGFTVGMTASNFSSAQNDDNGGAFILDFTAATETEVPIILKHMTSSVDDTETYLNALTYVPA